MDVLSGHITNLMVKGFRGYEILLCRLWNSWKDGFAGIQLNPRRHGPFLRWSHPLEGWIKINMDASMRDSTKLATIGYIMSDCCSHVIMAMSKRLGNCPTLVPP